MRACRRVRASGGDCAFISFIIPPNFNPTNTNQTQNARLLIFVLFLFFFLCHHTASWVELNLTYDTSTHKTDKVIKGQIGSF